MKLFFFIFLISLFQTLENKQIKNNLYIKVPINEIIQELELEKLTKEDCEKIIKNLIILLDRYVFLDISKNPPQPKESYHKSFDLIEELNKINKENNTYYDFYREVKIAFGKTKDLHLSLTSNITFSFCFPLIFFIKEKEKDIFNIYGKLNEDCSDFLTEEIKSKINKNINNSIISIKNENPFKYIQNYNGYFRTLRNVHSQFSLNLRMISQSTFSNYPFKLNDLTNITIEYENKDIVNLDYIGIKPNKINKEFYSFYNKEMLKNIDNSIFDIEKKFLILKGEKKIKKTLNEIKWDYQTEDNNFKCRVDNENKINVFYQSSFSLDYYKSPYTFYNCFSLFNNNNYPIIGIENENGGGIVELSILLQNILQPKITQNLHFSMKNNEKVKFAYGNIFNETSNIETCEIYNNPNELFEKIETDDYGNNILHNRTTIFNFGISKYNRLKYNNNRYYYKKNLRKNIEILIFTDSFSYSATSVFIKGLQNTGSAIIVGYNGNPYLNNEIFDASQSPSFVFPHYSNCIEEDGKCISCEDNDIYEIWEEKKLCIVKDYSNIFKELFLKNFIFRQLTIVQTYDDNYKNNTIKYKIPREYLIDEIDFRSNLYNKYTDERYDEFIKEGKKIFDYFKTNCNPKNEKLVFESENCNFNDNITFGGFLCDKNGNWSNICKGYYCEIGYFFDQFEQKCIKDPCFLESKIYEKEIDEEIIVKKDKEEILSFLNNNFTYFIISDYDFVYEDNYLKTKFYCFNPQLFQSKNIFLNKGKNIKNDVKVKIKSFDNKVNCIINRNEKDFQINNIIQVNNETKEEILFFQSNKDYILYINSEDGNSRIYGSEYNNSILPEDIVNVKIEKFNDITNKLIIIKNDTLYILFKKIDGISSLNYLIQPLEIKDNEIILKNSTKKYFNYLQKDKTYTIKINEPLSKVLIKLSRNSPLSELTITNKLTNEEKNINAKNLYYEMKSEITIKVKNSDSLIEFLYQYHRNITQLNDKSITKYQLNNNNTKGHVFIIFNPKEEILNLKISLESENEFNYYFTSGFSKLPFFNIPRDYNEKKVKNMSFIVKNPFKDKKIKLEKNEDFVILISGITNDINNKMYLNYEYIKNPGDNNYILLIAFLIIIGLIIIAIVIFYILKKKNDDIDSSELGELLN